MHRTTLNPHCTNTTQHTHWHNYTNTHKSALLSAIDTLAMNECGPLRRQHPYVHGTQYTSVARPLCMWHQTQHNTTDKKHIQRAFPFLIERQVRASSFRVSNVSRLSRNNVAITYSYRNQNINGVLSNTTRKINLVYVCLHHRSSKYRMKKWSRRQIRIQKNRSEKWVKNKKWNRAPLHIYFLISHNVIEVQCKKIQQCKSSLRVHRNVIDKTNYCAD